jgi:hypothetical protein
MILLILSRLTPVIACTSSTQVLKIHEEMHDVFSNYTPKSKGKEFFKVTIPPLPFLS